MRGGSRCKTQRGQSFQAVKTATTRKPYPVPPGQSEAHDTPETTHQHSKETPDVDRSRDRYLRLPRYRPRLTRPGGRVPFYLRLGGPRGARPPAPVGPAAGDVPASTRAGASAAVPALPKRPRDQSRGTLISCCSTGLPRSPMSYTGAVMTSSPSVDSSPPSPPLAEGRAVRPSSSSNASAPTPTTSASPSGAGRTPHERAGTPVARPDPGRLRPVRGCRPTAARRSPALRELAHPLGRRRRGGVARAERMDRLAAPRVRLIRHRDPALLASPGGGRRVSIETRKTKAGKIY